VPPQLDGLSATPLRQAYFDADPAAVDALLAGPARQQLPAAVVNWLTAFRATQAYRNLVEEWAFAKRYRQAWAAAPYPPIFVTADAVVIRGGQILMIRRKRLPGAGLWALPGGFVEQDEVVLDAALRELTEETALEVDEAELRAALVTTQVLDAPYRDIRGRVITHASLFHLPAATDEAPVITAADDAEAAQWTSLADLRRETTFSDHFQIIARYAALIGQPLAEDQ